MYEQLLQHYLSINVFLFYYYLYCKHTSHVIFLEIRGERKGER